MQRPAPTPRPRRDLLESCGTGAATSCSGRGSCPEGISIELWTGVGSSHAPGYGDAFVDALLGWLLSQE